ncbi:MAG: ImmA/IrrE family metallo-endopeptidase [Desulfitobacteriaceae bacterium]|nr:ImmA/IrrE family metallo-endopeptidase [Desulfitobacteriaceae bacterium]
MDKKNNNTPIISDVEIDELAENLLRDYKPQLLKEPGKVKFEHFLESYLGVDLDYRHIYYEENEGQIFGVTSFNQGEELLIFDKENMCLKRATLNRNTIVLDFYVTEEGREGLELFTGLHEGGHFWLHQGVYARAEMQLSLFQTAQELRPVTCCRQADIESFGKKSGFSTPEEWREHHADYFAAAIAMPNTTFYPLVKEVIKSQGLADGRIIQDAGFAEYSLAHDLLPDILAQTYGVSRSAAYIKLRKTGFVVEQETVNYDLFLIKRTLQS